MERVKKSTSAFRLFENRRQYPRLKLSNLPVKVTGAKGKTLKATLHDISPDGAQLRYLISEGLNLFVDDKAQVGQVKSVKCHLEFVLNYKGDDINVKLQGKPVYIRTVSQRVMATGIIFIENDLSELKKVSDYLFYQLELSYSGAGNWAEPNLQAGQSKRVEKNVPDKKEVVADSPKAGTGENKAVQPGTNTDVDFMHAEIRRLTSSMKTLMEATRRLDERIHKIEQFLSKKSG